MWENRLLVTLIIVGLLVWPYSNIMYCSTSSTNSMLPYHPSPSPVASLWVRHSGKGSSPLLSSTRLCLSFQGQWPDALPVLVTGVDICCVWDLAPHPRWCLPFLIARAAWSSVGQSLHAEFLVRPNTGKGIGLLLRQITDEVRGWAGAPFGNIGTNYTCVIDKTEDSVLTQSFKGRVSPSLQLVPALLTF